jgi:hypothetical protein
MNASSALSGTVKFSGVQRFSEGLWHGFCLRSGIGGLFGDLMPGFALLRRA